MGRLTAQPDIRNTQSGLKVATFTLAVDRRGKDKDADFIRIQAWDKRAEFTEMYLNKGTKILVTGRIQTGSYTDRDGKKVYTTDVVAEDIEFAESKRASEEKPAEEAPSDQGFAPVPDDTDLPFK